MPHPGVYAAATSPANGIPQSADQDGIGEYAVRAGVVSPTINVMCVNISHDELAPLVYTEWPGSSRRPTGVGTQTKGWDGWRDEVPLSAGSYLNRTVVDDVFRWGPEYGRWPPVFQLVSPGA